MVAVLALLSSVMWGTSDFLGGKLARRRPPLAIVGFGMVFGLFVMLVVMAATGAWSAPLGYLGWAICASISGLVGLLMFYRALAIGTMGVVSPIAAVGIVVPLVGGLIAGDIPSPVQAAGVVFAIAGLGFVVAPEREVMESTDAEKAVTVMDADARSVHRKSILLAALSAVCFGVALAAIARGSLISPIMTMTSMRLSSVVIIAVVALSLRSVGGVTRHDLPQLAVVGVFDVAANLTYGLAASGGALVVAAVLGSLYPVFTVLLAWHLLGERLRRIQYLGIALALLGVVLMSID
ncbi:MAG: DMT family transporter [Actinomycetes bacterium]